MAENSDFYPPWKDKKPAELSWQDWNRLTEAYWIYTNTYFRHTEVTKNFLHPANVAMIVQMINVSLRQITEEPTYEMGEFYDGNLAMSLSEVAYGNSAYANTGSPENFGTSVDALSGKFIDMWITDLWIGWREKQRYQQYMIEDNRLKQFPYPEQEEHSNNAISYNTGDYIVSSPWNNGHADFLKRYRHPCTNMPDIKQCPDKAELSYFFDQVFAKRCTPDNTQ